MNLLIIFTAIISLTFSLIGVIFVLSAIHNIYRGHYPYGKYKIALIKAVLGTIFIIILSVFSIVLFFVGWYS